MFAHVPGTSDADALSCHEMLKLWLKCRPIRPQDRVPASNRRCTCQDSENPLPQDECLARRELRRARPIYRRLQRRAAEGGVRGGRHAGVAARRHNCGARRLQRGNPRGASQEEVIAQLLCVVAAQLVLVLSAGVRGFERGWLLMVELRNGCGVLRCTPRLRVCCYRTASNRSVRWRLQLHKHTGVACLSIPHPCVSGHACARS